MSYQQQTLSDIRDTLKAKYESVPFWSDEQARLAINEALRVWNMLTGMWRGSLDMVTLANDPWHPLSGSVTRHTRVLYNGIALGQTSMFSMDHHRPTWENDRTDDGGSIPTVPKLWMPGGLQLIAIWPADAVGNHTLTVEGVVTTPILTNDTDFIDIGEEEFDTLLGYALHYLTFKEGGVRFEATMPLYQAFLAAAGLKNERLKRSDTYRKVLGTDDGRQQHPVVG